MTRDDDFVRAVCEAPDDDVLRLVYADWLEDHGRCERAELIRVQCALAAGDPPDRADLERRAHDLLRAHGVEWSAPFRHLATSWEYRRGFVEDVRVEARTFLLGADELFSRAPVRHLLLYWGALMPPYERARLVPRLFGCPRLRHLRSLDLTNNYLGSAGAQALAVCEYLSGLSALHLGNNHIGDAGARALAESPLLLRLTRLDLSNNDLGPGAVRALSLALRAAERPALRLIDLRGNRLGLAGAREVLSCPVLRRIAVAAVADEGPD
jgi:uncharacterized protein (TIGR02996 family)